MGGRAGSRRAQAGGPGAPGAGEGTGGLGSGVLSGDQDRGAQAALSASNTSEVKANAAAKEPRALTPPGHPSHSPGASRPRRGREAVSPCNRELASPPPQRVWDPWHTAQSHSAGPREAQGEAAAGQHHGERPGCSGLGAAHPALHAGRTMGRQKAGKPPCRWQWCHGAPSDGRGDQVGCLPGCLVPGSR